MSGLEAPERTRSGPRRRPAHVLVVDDDVLVGQVLARLLAPSHRVEVAASGLLALELLLGGARYDVVLCDVTMPDMTGIQLYDEVARTMPEQAERFVFVTAGVTSASERRRLQDASALVLDKPVDVDRLLAVVDAFIRGPLTSAALAI